MRRIGAVAVLVLSSSLGCLKQPPPEPVTVTFLDVEWEAPDRLPALARELEAFTRETGVRVKRLPAPDGSLNQLALWRESLQRGVAGPDVYAIDVIWSGILNQYLMDLKPYFESELTAQDPTVLASYTVGDKLVAVPHHAYIGALFYRSDLLERYGYHEPPQTWDELEQMASRIQIGQRAKGEKDFWGFVWQGAPGEDLSCSGLEWQVSEGAGQVIESDSTISVSNPQTIRTWQRARRWVGSISSTAVTAYAKWDVENVWLSGKTAFMRGWASDFSLITLTNPPANARQFGVTSLPGGAGGRSGTLGGNGLAVSRMSAHPHEAIELIRFLRRRDLQLKRAGEHAERPRELELYALPSILDPYLYGATPSRHGGGVVARPSVVAGEKYEEVTRAYIRGLHSVLTGETDSSTAVMALEKELVKITGFKTGPVHKAPVQSHDRE